MSVVHSITGSGDLSKESLSEKSDQQLLCCLEQVAKSVLGRSKEIKQKLDELDKSFAQVQLEIENVANELDLLSNNQFIEKRTSDDGLKRPSRPALDSRSNQELTSQSFEQRILKNSVQALGLYFSNGERPKDQYNRRPLPHLISSSKYYDDPSLGLSPSTQHVRESKEFAIANLPVSGRKEEQAKSNVRVATQAKLPQNEEIPARNKPFKDRANSSAQRRETISLLDEAIISFKEKASVCESDSGRTSSLDLKNGFKSHGEIASIQEGENRSAVYCEQKKRFAGLFDPTSDDEDSSKICISDMSGQSTGKGNSLTNPTFDASQSEDSANVSSISKDSIRDRKDDVEQQKDSMLTKDDINDSQTKISSLSEVHKDKSSGPSKKSHYSTDVETKMQTGNILKPAFQFAKSAQPIRSGAVGVASDQTPSTIPLTNTTSKDAKDFKSSSHAVQQEDNHLDNSIILERPTICNQRRPPTKSDSSLYKRPFASKERLHNDNSIPNKKEVKSNKIFPKFHNNMRTEELESVNHVHSVPDTAIQEANSTYSPGMGSYNSGETNRNLFDTCTADDYTEERNTKTNSNSIGFSNKSLFDDSDSDDELFG